jgi:hypothetical protein
MRPLVVAFLGVGSLRCGPPVLASFANYFGERDVELRLFDPDPEMLDLFDRLARSMFVVEQSKHHLLACADLSEALDGAAAVVAIDEARLMDPIGGRQAVWVRLSALDVLWLPQSDWPPPLQGNATSEAHRVLRWVRGDEYIGPFLAEHRRTPVSRWLDAATALR